MTITLRPLHSRDLELIARWTSTGELDAFISRRRPRDAEATCHDPQNGLFWFVIADTDTEVGTVWLEPGQQPNESTLGIFLGDPTLFGQGIGAQAIQLAVDECRARYPSQVITLRVREGNTRAIACYEKVGFVAAFSGTKRLSSGEEVPYLQMQLLPPRALHE